MQMKFGTIAAIAGLTFSATVLCAEQAGGVYKCTDEMGAVTYSSSRCKGAKREFLSKEKLEGKTTTVEFPKPVTPTPAVPAAPRSEPPAKPAVATPAPATAVRISPPAPIVIDNAVAPATLPAKPQIRRLPIESKKKD